MFVLPREEDLKVVIQNEVSAVQLSIPYGVKVQRHKWSVQFQKLLQNLGASYVHGLIFACRQDVHMIWAVDAYVTMEQL